MRSCHVFLLGLFVCLALSFDSAASQLTVGGSGRCLSFMRTNQFAQVPVLPGLDTTRAVTVEMWARSFSPSQTFVLFSLVTPDRIRFAWTGSEGMICFNQLYTLAEIAIEPSIMNLNISSRVWHHYALIIDANASTCTLVIDGQRALSVTARPISTNFTGSTLNIGQLQQDRGLIFDPTYAFLGQVDEIRVWSQARIVNDIRTSMQFSYGNESVPRLVSSWSFDKTMTTYFSPAPSSIQDHLNATFLELGSYKILSNRTVVQQFDYPILARSTCPIVASGSPIVVTTDKWTEIRIDLKFSYAGSEEIEYKILNLAQGAIYPIILPNGTTGSEVSSSNSPLPRSAIIYKPNSLLFSDAGDSFSYEISIRNSTLRASSLVIIDHNIAPSATVSSISVPPNTVRRITLPCIDANGELPYVEIISLPSRGTLHQLQNPSLFESQQQIGIGEPITTAGTTLLHPANAVAYVPPDNLPFSEATNIQYLCHDIGSDVVSFPTTANFLLEAVPETPLAGYGQYALQFDGVNSVAYSELSNATETTVRTIELWAKFFSNPSNSQRSQRLQAVPRRQALVQGIYDSIGQYYFVFFVETVDALTFRLGLGNHNFSSGFSYSEVLSDPLVSIEADKWHHLAVSVKEPAATFYVNGQRFGSPVSIGAFSVARRIQIGALTTVNDTRQITSQHFFGVIDEVRLWQNSLDSPELTTSMQNSPSSPLLNDVTFVWNFNEGTSDYCIDSTFRRQRLQLGTPGIDWNRPRWVISDGPQFTTIVGKENDPILVYLTAGLLEKADTAFAYAIVELPRMGRLYQYGSNNSNGATIDSAFFDWNIPSSLSQWASIVTGYSSYRATGRSSAAFLPENALGTPFNVSMPSNSATYTSSPVSSFANSAVGPSANSSRSSWSVWPVQIENLSSNFVYGSSPMWVPSVTCNLTSEEHIEVGFDVPVYPRQVELYGTFSEQSYLSIWMWDRQNNTWRPLYLRSDPLSPAATNPSVPDVPTIQRFSPNFCEPILPTDRLRIVVDPCRSPPWSGLAGIRLLGPETPRSGLVTDTGSRIVYVPPPYQSGANADSFSFAAISCPYNMRTATAPVRISVDIEPRNNPPLSSDMRLAAQEGSDVMIQLRGFDPDEDVIKFIVSSLPSGTIYQLSNSSEKAEPITQPGTVVRHPRGSVIWSPPRTGPSCGIQYANFTYFVTDVSSSSNVSLVIIDVNCTPGAYSITFGLLYTSWSIAAALLVFGTILFILAVLFRGHKSVRKSQPALLIIMLIGAIACYASVFMFSTRLSDATCHIRIWLLNIGITLTLGTLVVKMFHIWRTFSAKMFRRNSELSPTHTAIFLAVIVAIEMGQLLVYSIVAAPYMQEEIDPQNNAIRHQTCLSSIAFSPMYLFIYKGVLVVLTTCIYVLIRSVTKTRFKPESLEMLLFSVYGMFISGAVAVPILLLVKDRDALFLLGCIAIAAPVTICLILVFTPKIRAILRKTRENNDDSIEQFTLRAMSSSPTSAASGGTPKKSKANAKKSGKKSGKRIEKELDPTQDLMELSKYSEDKSVLELLEAIQGKDSEIAALKSKIVKTQYKMQNLKQRLMTTEHTKRGRHDDYDDEL